MSWLGGEHVASVGGVLVQVLAVNHGTIAYAELMLRSLLHHHVDRAALRITLLDNGSADVERLAPLRDLGVEVCPSGYRLDHQVTTHGEILAAAVLDRPHCEPTCSSTATSASVPIRRSRRWPLS